MVASRDVLVPGFPCPTLTTIQIKDVVPDRAAFFFW